MQLTPARVSSLLAGASVLAAGLAPAIANMDTTSTAGAIAGAIAVLGVLESFLKGQRAHEARVASDVATPEVVPVAQPLMGGTMAAASGDWRKGVPVDDGDDGDDQLPAELAELSTSTPPVPDEVDQPDPNHPEVQS